MIWQDGDGLNELETDMFTKAGLQALREFINENGTDRVREAYSVSGESAWIDSTSDDGFLELQARYAKDGRPHTIQFAADEFIP
jgi:hypothetical protein